MDRPVPGDGPVEYVNLAIRGRLLAPIVTEQLDAALALGPTVLTFNGGGTELCARASTCAASMS